ncbi:type II secretion system F family protein [Arthrobacter sp. ERGS1:01]|uniref:type II secretion system F family protein n=1 Tax=Arthrobacter sp. ERGS1:01 TaxID=1704044 RepID=UPI0006B4B800|nr:hypothetical protein [Arthrobacter sp. ERGS1:01]
MMAATVFLLTAAACIAMSLRRRPWPPEDKAAGLENARDPAGWSGRGRRRGPDMGMPRIVRQLAALLASGRNGPSVWGALAEVLAAEFGPAGRVAAGGAAVSTGPTLALVIAVERACLLGLPVAEALRAAVLQAASAPHPLRWNPGTVRMSGQQRRMWLEVAACFEICEASGAPVAAVLARLAGRLEAEQDAAALRETALAGPRATVRLLTWLPFVGLGLGMAMGVNPVGVLLGGPLGWACLGLGLALVAAGRWWSNRLIAAASRPAGVRPAGLRRGPGPLSGSRTR